MKIIKTNSCEKFDEITFEVRTLRGRMNRVYRKYRDGTILRYYGDNEYSTLGSGGRIEINPYFSTI